MMSMDLKYIKYNDNLNDKTILYRKKKPLTYYNIKCYNLVENNRKMKGMVLHMKKLIISIIIIALAIVSIQIPLNAATTKANIKVEYSYNEEKNTVTATIISDKQLKDTKPTWKLSTDKLKYTKTFSENQTYTTPVIDCDGNQIDVKISITQIKKKVANINVTYQYNSDSDTVTAKIQSDIPLKATKPTWSLSNDKLTFGLI